MQGKRPEIQKIGDQATEELGPGSYDVDRKPIGEQIKVKYLKEYYKELAVVRESQKEEVARRREALNKMKEEVRNTEADDLYARLEAVKLQKTQKAPFNSSSDRDQEARIAAKAPIPGPGSYNSINQTIMEGYIKAAMSKEKVKKSDFEWRVYTGIVEPKPKTDLGNYYNLAGAFDSTMKKAKRANFITKQMEYPSSFGSSSRRF